MPPEQPTTAARPHPAPRPGGPDDRAGAAQARDAVRRAILDGEYLPGERLVEASLCERFGVSRFLVRTALQDLAAEGLVEVRRNRGAHVRKVSISEAVEITEVRMAVEGLVAGRAATLVTDDECSDLDEIGLLMQRAVTAGEFRRYSELNQRLHSAIRDIAAHRTANTIIETMHGQLVRHQYALSLLPGRPEASLPQHLRIIEAIRARNPQEAETAMREHIASIIEALRSLDGTRLA